MLTVPLIQPLQNNHGQNTLALFNQLTKVGLAEQENSSLRLNIKWNNIRYCKIRRNLSQVTTLPFEKADKTHV